MSAAVPPVSPSATRGVRLLLFVALWLAFAFFHSGGGWNQNSRFAQVRSIVEARSWSVDDFVVYASARGGGDRVLLGRVEVDGGELSIDGRPYVLTWRPGGRAIDGRAHPGAVPVALERVTASGDLAWARGHLVPNKAPGTVWLAVPAYALVRAIEAPLGLDPDDWWVLTVNAWLTGAFSIGLLGALGGLLVYALALELGSDHRCAAAAALVWGLGTLTWPYGTMLYEHVPAAVLLAAAVLLVFQVERGRGAPLPGLLAAGIAAGVGCTVSYLLVPVAALLALWALRAVGWRGALAFAVGLGGPLTALAVYHQTCFGSPWATAYAFQNPEFLAAGTGLFGVLQPPRLDRLLLSLVSPFRGLWFGSPVLLLAVPALWSLGRRRRERTFALVAALVVAFFLLFTASFNGWHGGWASGPRYVVPMLPLLAAPLALAFRRWPRWTTVLAGVSIAVQLLSVAVDAQPAVGVASIASRPGVPRWRQSPLLDYQLPLFVEGRATPILDALGSRGALLASFRGPVSVNPMGVYEAWPGRLERLDSERALWNSFNAGELLAPRSRWSLLPLALLVGLPAALALRRAGRPRSSARSS